MHITEYIDVLNAHKQNFEIDNGRLKAILEAICKQSISDRTIRRWKGIIEAPAYRQQMSFGDAVALCAIAHLKEGCLQQRVTSEDILRLLFNKQTFGIFLDYVEGSLEVGILGSSVATCIYKQTGRRWSRASLYRKLPGFSSQKVYYRDDIERFIKILERPDRQPRHFFAVSA